MRQTWWTRPAFLVVLALIPLVGWLVLAVLPRGVVVGALLAMGLGVVVIGSRTAPPRRATPPAPPPPAQHPPDVSTPASPDGLLPFTVKGPAELPTFADVGGMLGLKTELKDTVGLARGAPADPRRWNGLLLHGPPEVGKSFIAEAAAGEFGLNLVHVTTADVVSSYAGEHRAFAFAAARIPCILFFDELDAIAQRGDHVDNQEARRTLSELLRQVEQSRRVPELIVMAATNERDALDPAVIRPGCFDRHIRVDLPDAPARAAILGAAVKGKPLAPDVDLQRLAVSAEGLTPAAIARAVEAASRAALNESTGSADGVQLTAAHLRTALTHCRGTDRPSVEDWSWDRLILPGHTKAELQQVAAMVRSPELARTLGVEPPAGLLLTGPPGTGKSTIAKVFAAQAGCSFHPITGADVTSPGLGQSERSMARLFDRARENQPSIIYFDEIDAIAGTWAELLAGIDGVGGRRGVFVVGATDRPDELDRALLRSGRLSRSIEIPLPDFKGRIALLQLFTAGVPLDRVDVDELARHTAGLSGADLKALCQEAAVAALTRSAAVVTADDMRAALAKRRGAPSRAGRSSDQ